MSYYQKFVKDIGLLSITNFLVTLRGLLLVPILTKSLDPAHYGMWVQFSITLTLATSIVTLGLPYAVIRFVAGEREKRLVQDGVWSSFLIAGASAFFLLFGLVFFSDPIAAFLEIPPLFLGLLGLAIFLESTSLILLSAFRAFQKVRLYSLFTFLSVGSEIGFVALAVWFGYGLSGAILAFLASKLFIFLLAFAATHPMVGFAIPRFSRVKKYLTFGLPLLMSGAAFWVVQSSDRYLITLFLGVLFVGYYAPAYALGNMIHFLVMPFALALPPALSKLSDEGKLSEVQTYLKYSLKYFLLLAIPAVFGLSALSEQLLTIISTKEIASQAHGVIPYVAMSLVLYGIYTIVFQVLFLYSRTALSGLFWVGAALLNIGLNLVLIPLLGILGAALTTLLAYLFATSLTWYYSSKHLTFPIDWQAIGKSILASLLMAGTILWFHAEGTVETLLAVIMGGLFYGLALFGLKVFSKEEIAFFRKLFRERQNPLDTV